MPPLEELIKMEQPRTTAEDWLLVHLILENGFYRAYEESAFIFSTRVETYKVRFQRYKEADRMVRFVGFPPGNFKKITEANIEIEVTDGTHAELKLPAPTDEVLPDAATQQANYEAWCDANQPEPAAPAAPRKKAAPAAQKADKEERATVFGILQCVMDYPLEHRTLIENVEFLSDLKRQIARVM